MNLKGFRTHQCEGMQHVFHYCLPEIFTDENGNWELLIGREEVTINFCPWCGKNLSDDSDS